MGPLMGGSLLQRTVPAVLLLLLALTTAAVSHADDEGSHRWSDGEKAVLRSLWLETLPPLPAVVSNKYADDPAAAVLGRKFFFDKRFSGNQEVSCGTCHRPDYSFTDSFPLAHGMGTTARRTMPMIGLAYQPWFFWDGRKDSLWSQALGPIESPVEHGFTRTLCYTVIRDNYGEEYGRVFGPLTEVPIKARSLKARPASDDASALKAWVTLSPEAKSAVNRAYTNMGKAIGAYGRTLLPGEARFDTYVRAALDDDRALMGRTFSPLEVSGLRLFIGKAKCTNCHNGPLLTNGDFHDLGIPAPGDTPPDVGRSAGIIKVLADEFNCLSEYSDATPRECAELRFLDTTTDKYTGAFKTPTLRNAAVRPPYMHAGQFDTLREVLEFYREASREHTHEGSARHADLGHGDLTDEEIQQIEAFLHTLTGEIAEGGK
jgi:cytochrome c peroxidase